MVLGLKDAIRGHPGARAGAGFSERPQGAGVPGRPEILLYGVTREEAQRNRIPCGGAPPIRIEPMRDVAGFWAVCVAISRRQAVTRLLDMQTGAARVRPAEARDGVRLAGEIFRAACGPRWRLYLIGAGAGALPGVTGADAGLPGLRIDPREDYIASWDVADAPVFRGMPDDVLKGARVDVHTAVVAAARGAVLDDLALSEVLNSPAFYVGAPGSEVTTARRRERLAMFDLTANEIQRLCGPVGLYIGSRAPPEIALSILAEMILVRNGIARLQAAALPGRAALKAARFFRVAPARRVSCASHRARHALVIKWKVIGLAAFNPDRGGAMGKSDELQKAILNNIPDQAWLKDREGRYILVNEAFMAATGLTENDILGRKPVDVWPAEWGRKYIETDQAVMQTGQRARYEEWRHVQDGALRWFDTIKTPIFDGQGNVVGTAGISRDITDRKLAEQALARLNRLYAVRSRTNQAIARISDRGQLFYRVCRVAVQSGGLQLAWIGLFGENGSIPHPAACFSGKPPLSRKLAQHLEAQADPDFAKWRAPSFRHFVCNNLAAARHFTRQTQLAQSLGFSSLAAFPLEQGGQRAGIFMLYAAEPDFFSDDIVQLLAALSLDLSYALDFIAEAQRRRDAEQELRESRAQLRELSAYLQSVREEERTRISRELHDELGQSLTAIRIGLGVIETQEQMQPDAWLKSVQSLKTIADSTIESVQRIAADLRPLILDELGLPAAVDWLLESFSERTGVAYELILPGPPLVFSREISTAIFRILQEALTNVSRHGQASLVVVELKQDDRMIALKITDNGRGIDKAAMTSRSSLGLVGMRERAYKLGGALKIQSRPGAGTSVEVRIPKDFSTFQEHAHDPGPGR